MKASDIFAEDQEGNGLKIGDVVKRRGRIYKIRDIHWDVSGDGYYTETVTLSVEDLKNGKDRIFEDNQVLLVSDSEANSMDTEELLVVRKTRSGKGVDLEIRVWRFSDAPAEFRALSPHGGDEDWVAYIPKALCEEWIGWMEPGTAFGCCHVSRHAVQGGIIKIGSHS
jgi:hypothetical protein